MRKMLYIMEVVNLYILKHAAAYFALNVILGLQKIWTPKLNSTLFYGRMIGLTMIDCGFSFISRVTL